MQLLWKREIPNGLDIHRPFQSPMLGQEAEAAAEIFEGTIFATIRNYSTTDMLLTWVLWCTYAMAYGWGKAQPRKDPPNLGRNPHTSLYKNTNCWGGAWYWALGSLVFICSLYGHLQYHFRMEEVVATASMTDNPNKDLTNP